MKDKQSNRIDAAVSCHGDVVVVGGGDSHQKSAVTNGYGHHDVEQYCSNGDDDVNKTAVVRRRSVGRRHQNNHGGNHVTEQLSPLPVVDVIDGGLHLTTAADEQHQVAGAELAEDIPTRLQILQDPANLCTFAGAVLATLAMASMWRGRYYVGMCLNVAANIADIIDGPIARSTPNRSPLFGVVGCKLDCYSDLVSHFVVPASLLMHLTNCDPICTALAAAYVCTGILRQSYFEITGRCDNGSCIYGMTSDYMVALYAVTMHLGPLVGLDRMSLVLGACVLLMIFSSLTFSLRSRRYDGFGLLTVTAYNVLLLASCVVLACCCSPDGDDVIGGGCNWIAGPLLVANLVLAYPCYFRFVELNR